jgi:anti-sigma B factor antagonist
MEIEIIQSDKQLLRIAISGKLDTNAIGNHAWELTSLFANTKANVALDFSGVTYLSSLGIRMLLSASKELQKSAKNLKIENPSEETEKVLRMAGLDMLL